MIFGLLAAFSASLAWTISTSIWRSCPSAVNAAKLNAIKNAIALAIFLPVLFSFNWGENKSDTFIVLTEPGILHQMRKNAPEKLFLEVPDINGCSCNKCPYMRLNTIEKVIDCLNNMTPKIIMEEEIRTKALKPIQKMLEMSS